MTLRSDFPRRSRPACLVRWFLLAAGLSLAGCAERTVQYPFPVSNVTGTNTRVSGALKPGGGTAIKSGSRRDAVSRDEIYNVEGSRVGRPGRAGVTTLSGGDSVSLSFANADLVEVVDVILGQTLGLNYTIDPTVGGTVTLRTTRPIDRDALLGVLENVLALNSAALVSGDEFYTILPVDLATELPGTVIVNPNASPYGRGQAIYVIPVTHTSATALRDVVKSVVAPGREIAIDPVRNLMIFIGSGQEAQSIEQMVSVLDVDAMAGRAFGIFPTEVADTDEVVRELEVIFGVGEEGGGAIQFLALTRMNAVLVIATKEAYLERARRWVGRLDRADTQATAQPQVFVYYVRNGIASRLASVLAEVFGGESTTTEVAVTGDLAPTLDPVRLGAGVDQARLGAGVDPERLASAAAEAPDEDRPAARRGGSVTVDTAIFSGGSGPGLSEAGGPSARFIADDRNNSIVIVATPAQYEIAKATLDRLDVMPLQVLIEATIAEVSLRDELQYGLQWFFENGDFSATLSTLATGIVRETFPGFNLFWSGPDVRVVLNALAQVTDVNVISSPQLTVMDNQAARLQVGDQVPVATRSAVSVINPDAPIVNSVELVDTGVILEVTPRVNSSGLVTLEVIQEVSVPVPTNTSDIDSPTIQQRRIETNVAVNDGETVALGGLILDRTSVGDEGIPLLKDIPIAGNLFKSTEKSARRTELLVLITPRVLRDSQQARLVAEELRARLPGISRIVPPIDGTMPDGPPLPQEPWGDDCPDRQKECVGLYQ